MSMATICPTVLARDPHEYRIQMERIQSFAKRVQIDLTDGHFAKVKTVTIPQVWWPAKVTADLHLMFRRPGFHLKEILNLHPSMVIVHAEAEGSFVDFAQRLRDAAIKVGVALLPETPVAQIKPALEYIDHVLIFSGDLGHFGGRVDTHLLVKAQECKALKPELEIGWDGGVNDTNVHLLAAGGIDVLNVGGFIQKASDAQHAYDTLVAKL